MKSYSRHGHSQYSIIAQADMRPCPQQTLQKQTFPGSKAPYEGQAGLATRPPSDIALSQCMVKMAHEMICKIIQKRGHGNLLKSITYDRSTVGKKSL